MVAFGGADILGGAKCLTFEMTEQTVPSDSRSGGWPVVDRGLWRPVATGRRGGADKRETPGGRWSRARTARRTDRSSPSASPACEHHRCRHRRRRSVTSTGAGGGGVA